MDVLIATTNPGKLVEIKAIFERYFSLPVKLVTPADACSVLKIKEDGQTYAENAAKKALAYSKSCCMLSLADDSGLEVDALCGEPGLHSARYTGKPGATDADRRAFLLRNLKPCDQPWQARFRCVVALALPDGEVFTSEGECSGQITPEERGTRGFGYDPVFQIGDPAYGGRTMAELSLGEKNRISHRAAALRGIFPALEKLLEKNG